jgi:hypothetical protein
VSSRSRAALLAAAAVVLVVAFIVASSSGGDDDTTTTATQATAPAATSTADGTETAEGTGGEPAPAPEPEPEPEPEPAPRVETIRVEGGENVTGDPQDLEYEKGDTIRLRFVSDEAMEVHIHGFDKYVDVPAGGSERAVFKANIDGIYEVENHGNGAQLARLEIQP